MQAANEPHSHARVIPGSVIESITVDAPIDTVWAALSRSDIRSVWSKLPGRDATYELDFRSGGSEVRTSTFPNIDRDERLAFRARFVEIAAPHRVVTAEELELDGELRMAFLVSWDLVELGDATRVDYTEQYLVLVPTGDGTANQRERRGGVPMMLRRFKITVEELD